MLQHLRLLFVGHSDLMSAFNCLLPPKFKLEDDHRLQFRMPEKESQETEHTSWNDTTIFSSAKADMDKVSSSNITLSLLQINRNVCRISQNIEIFVIQVHGCHFFVFFCILSTKHIYTLRL